MYKIDLARPDHDPAIEALLDLSFGPGRYAKTAQRLREGNQPVLGLEYVAFSDDEIPGPNRLIGSLSFWPIAIGGKRALMLGPLAIEPQLRGRGCGIHMMERGLADARAMGYRVVILVGDAPYYAKVGFGPVLPGKLIMPGPVDQNRLLYRELDIGAFANMSGAVTIAKPNEDN